MKKLSRYFIWILLGAVILYFVANFSLASQEQLNESINNSVTVIFVSKLLACIIASIAWIFLSYLFIKLSGNNTSPLKDDFLTLLLIYTAISILMIIIFIYKNA